MHKNIVLLSDGTGNSAAKPFKTNVWRLYQALDIAEPADQDLPRQVVYYDGGVGTENFKPLAALRGAFGFGVWTNVKDLYTFVCRNYDVGDQIYGFGFSRGAFTIRLLMGLIGRCGVITAKPETEAALLQAVDMAYEAYRRDFLLRASENRGMIYHRILGKPRYDVIDDGRTAQTIDLRSAEESPVKNQIYPPIRFLGVWDTVDAYGMPIEEIKQAVDQWVWPMGFADRNLSKSVQCARHALSLDDERPTFRPVLWNEVPTDPLQSIQQVWFAGVHANIGGGYADDGLAYVALDWMMTEAAAANLRYWPGELNDVRWRANAHGEQYDSRSGIAAYYRYGPRQVHQLCNDLENKVHVPVVKVHASVFDRIAAHQVQYAPVSLNCSFALVSGSPNEYPPHEFLKPDENALLHAWRGVRSRRIAYFTTVLLTVYLVLFFLPHLGSVLGSTVDWLLKPLQPIPSHVLDVLGSMAAWIESVLSTLTAWLPDVVVGAVDWVVRGAAVVVFDPWTAMAALVVLAWLFFRRSNALQGAVAARAEWAWAAQKGLLDHPPAAEAAPPGPGPSAETSGVYPSKTPKIIINGLGVIIAIFTVVPLALVLWVRDRVGPKPWLASNVPAARGDA